MTTNSSIQTFLDDLASERPTPGGGGAAAVCGAIGAALVSMVANLTIGKKNYEAVSEDLAAVNAKAEAYWALRESLERGVIAGLTDEETQANWRASAIGIQLPVAWRLRARKTRRSAGRRPLIALRR